jgi:hypothetical protein
MPSRSIRRSNARAGLPVRNVPPDGFSPGTGSLAAGTHG